MIISADAPMTAKETVLLVSLTVVMFTWFFIPMILWARGDIRDEKRRAAIRYLRKSIPQTRRAFSLDNRR